MRLVADLAGAALAMAAEGEGEDFAVGVEGGRLPLTPPFHSLTVSLLGFGSFCIAQAFSCDNAQWRREIY